MTETVPTEPTERQMAATVGEVLVDVLHGMETLAERAERLEGTITDVDVIKRNVLLEREKRRTLTRAMMFAFPMLVLLVWIGVTNVHNGTVLLHCTEPHHECSDRGVQQTNAAVGKIVDTNANGIPDNAEILAAVKGQPAPPPVPTTTTTPSPVVVTHTTALSQVQFVVLVLVGLAVTVLVMLQFRPQMFRRRRWDDNEHPGRRIDDSKPKEKK